MQEPPALAKINFQQPERPELFSKPGNADGSQPATPPTSNANESRPPAPRTNAILLMSDDVRFAKNLRSATGHSGGTVVRVEELTETLRTLRVIQPAVVLLDLDTPSGATWEAADRLLLEPNCPPIILLTARTGQFDFRIAIRAGSVVDKSADVGQLLRLVDEVLAKPHPAQAERHAIQRVVVLWLKPFSWPVPVTPAYRDWGINE